MASPYQATPETLRSVLNSSITNAFVALGSALAHPSRILTFVNTTDKDMLLSVDGTNSHFIVPSGSSKVLDLTANRRTNDFIFAFRAGTQFYIKYVAAPSSGTFYIETIYGDDGS